MKRLFSHLFTSVPHTPQVASQTFTAPGSLHFQCNICGQSNLRLLESIERESSSCDTCGSTLRFRSLIAALTERLYGEPRALTAVERDPAVVGIGMSDAPCYAAPLAGLYDYCNTFYHCEPRLDITAPTSRWQGACDFIITSDVFEHVAPPVQRAFDNLRSLLKPGGFVIFSVPFSLEPDTREHYPDLFEFSIDEDADGQWVLRNMTAAGQQQEFRDLVFHGGPGSTLEMRLFSLAAIRRHFEKAGFVDVRVHDAADFAFGIHWAHPWSITMSARAPQ